MQNGNPIHSKFVPNVTSVETSVQRDLFPVIGGYQTSLPETISAVVNML